MALEEKLVNKLLYKIELYSNKVFPIVIASIYFLNTVLSYLGIDFEAFSWIAGMSLLPTIKLYVSSYTYKFCEYHRMFLHYIVINNAITFYDYYIGINIEYRTLFSIHVILFCITLFLVLYLKLKHEKKINKFINKRTRTFNR